MNYNSYKEIEITPADDVLLIHYGV